MGRRGAVLDDPAILDGQDAAALLGKSGIMRDKHQRGTGRRGGLEQCRDDLFAGAAVEVACRLVGKQDFRPRRDGARDGDTLLLAALHLVGKMRFPVTKPDRLQRLCGQIGGVTAAGKFQRHSDILQRRH